MLPAEAARSRSAAARGDRSPSARRVEGGARVREGRRETAADSDPGRAGPRRSAATTRSPWARECAPHPAPPPARRLARQCRPEKGRTATSASGPLGQPASAPSGGHTQRPGRRRGLGDSGCGSRGPGSATVPPAQALPRPGPSPAGGRAGGEWVPGGGGGRRSWAYLCAERRPLRPGPGTGIGGTVAGEGRRGCGGGPCGAEGGRSRSRCLGRAPSGASPALPALAAEGAAGSAPGLDSFTDTTPGRPAPRRDTPAPRRLLPPAGQPASPPLGVTHPGAHTQSRRPSLPLAHTALLTPLSGFVSAHTHVLTQIPSLHKPQMEPDSRAKCSAALGLQLPLSLMSPSQLMETTHFQPFPTHRGGLRPAAQPTVELEQLSGQAVSSGGFSRRGIHLSPVQESRQALKDNLLPPIILLPSRSTLVF